MVKVRALVAMYLTAMLFGGTAAAQSWEETIRYTRKPPDWGTYKQMREEADWLVRAFADPVAVLEEEPTKFIVALGRQDYELPNIKAMNATTLRQELGTKIVERAEYDPIFTAVLTIARTSTTDRYKAIAKIKLLSTCVKTYIGDYPGIAEPSREILLNDLQDERDEVRYLAIEPLALLGNAADSRKVTEVLTGLLSSNNQAFVEAAAGALGKMGDTTAVRALMEAFLRIPDDQDPAQEGEGKSGSPVNDARLQIATALQKLTGIDRGLADVGGMKKEQLVERYKQLEQWWSENKDKYP